MKLLGGLMIAAGGWLLYFGLPEGGGGENPPVGDVLAVAHDHDRVSRVVMLRQMDAKQRAGDFANDAEQADWHNSQGEEIRAEGYGPYVDAVAAAIYADRQDPESRAVLELADGLEPGS